MEDGEAGWGMGKEGGQRLQPFIISLEEVLGSYCYFIIKLFLRTLFIFTSTTILVVVSSAESKDYSQL